jgi:ParB-like chromosome segregation protein Spo0J
MSRIIWKHEKRLLSDLIPYNKNPRIITEEKLKDLKKSLDDIGFAQFININTENVILSGHARFYQLKKENAVEVDVLVPDRVLTPKQEEAVVIRMNKNIIGEWDFNILENEFNIDDLLDYGFTSEELMKINIPDFQPTDGNEQGELDKIEIEIRECPKCGVHFETKQAKIID